MLHGEGRCQPTNGTGYSMTPLRCRAEGPGTSRRDFRDRRTITAHHGYLDSPDWSDICKRRADRGADDLSSQPHRATLAVICHANSVWKSSTLRVIQDLSIADWVCVRLQ